MVVVVRGKSLIATRLSLTRREGLGRLHPSSGPPFHPRRRRRDECLDASVDEKCPMNILSESEDAVLAKQRERVIR